MDCNHELWAKLFFARDFASDKTTIQELRGCLFHHNIVFHKVLLLTKELTSQPEKYEIMESTCLTMFPTILTQLTWQKGRGPLEDTVTAPNSWLATAIGLRAGSQEASSIYCELASNTWSNFSHSQDPQVQQSRGENRNTFTLTITPSDTPGKF